MVEAGTPRSCAEENVAYVIEVMRKEADISDPGALNIDDESRDLLDLSQTRSQRRCFAGKDPNPWEALGGHRGFPYLSRSAPTLSDGRV